MTPQVRADPNAWDSDSGVMRTPALTSAKTGTMTRLTTRRRESWNRSLIDTERRMPSAADIPRSALGAAAEALREVLRLVDELVLRREDGQNQAEDDTGDCRVDPGLEDGEPEEDAEDRVDEAAPRLHPLDEPGHRRQGAAMPSQSRSMSSV